jgi:hypothetical protein
MGNYDRFEYLCSLYQVSATDKALLWQRVLQWRPALVEFIIATREKLTEYFGVDEVSLEFDPPFYDSTDFGTMVVVKATDVDVFLEQQDRFNDDWLFPHWEQTRYFSVDVDFEEGTDANIGMR